MLTHKKQEQFYRDGARMRWVFGGNRTGKTHCGAQEAVWRACCTHPMCEIRGATDGWVISLSGQVQRDVAQRKVLELLDKEAAESERRGDSEWISYECVMTSGKQSAPARGVIDFISVRNRWGTESRIGFKNCEQGREKFQGTALDWVWFDEEPDEDIFDECLMRTMDRGGLVWGTMTPIKGRTWVYERIFLNADTVQSGVSVITMAWEDNPFLSEKEIAKMERNYSAETLESRRYGRFYEKSGLVFKEFSEANIVPIVSISEIQKNWVYTGISIDPGYTNPTAVLWVAVDRAGSIAVVADYKEAGSSVPQIAKEIFERSAKIGFEVKNVFIDSAAAARTLAEPKSVAEQFFACGIRVNTCVIKNVSEGLHRIKSLFCSADGVRKLFVAENCVNLIAELRGYFWGDNERPVKSHDHCIDALRYFVMSAYVAPEVPRVNDLGKFKNRIIQNR